MEWDTEKETEIESLVNLTPLIDILLVVLLTLMMSVGISTFQTNVQLPTGEGQSDPSPSGDDHLEIFADGSLKLNQQALSFEEFRQVSRQVALNIYCDQKISYGELMKILTIAQANGYRSFQFHYQEG